MLRVDTSWYTPNDEENRGTDSRDSLELVRCDGADRLDSLLARKKKKQGDCSNHAQGWFVFF